MDYSDFFDACLSVASSVGELVSLVAAACFSFSVVVLRSVVRRMEQQNLTKSPSVSAPARRRRGPSARPSSSALPGGSAATSFPPPQEQSDNGISQAPDLSSPVDRFVSSLAPEERAALGWQPRADGPHPAGGTAAAVGDPDGGRPDDRGGSAAAGLVLGGKRPETAG